MRSGKIELAEGTKLIYALTSIGDLIEADVIVQRIEALEGRVLGK